MLQHGEQFENALVVMPAAGGASGTGKKSRLFVVPNCRSTQTGSPGDLSDGHRSSLALLPLDLNLALSGIVGLMMSLKSLAALGLIAAFLCFADNQAPFACSLKAFQPEQRVRWRALLDKLYVAATRSRELADGYAFRIDTSRMPVTEVAEWIELERRCCPFFDFELAVHGEDGMVWLSLKGRDGVKQFIETDMPRLHMR
jgi:hypothetical protein